MLLTQILGRTIDALRWRYGYMRQHHCGVQVSIFLDAPQTMSSNIRNALALIQSAHPFSIRLMQQHLQNGIAVEEGGTALAWYDRKRAACFLSGSHVTEDGPLDVACSIIHELAHARLEARGLKYEASTRYRIERICVRREIALMKRALHVGMASDEDLAAAKCRLEHLVDVDLTDEAVLRRWRQGKLEILRILGPKLPRFGRKLLVMWVRNRLRKLRTLPAQISR